ncbi:MAG: galactokinase [Salegentibacter sp.]|uniref:galactokinase n=1 Tax=Salegentibacter sp. TaxID=1903072 RepID=UPI0028705CCC|nr:galactokinase [Salegentibacter sp.]MDR9457749.1 galactokinase [Salegentibacter sp.]
MNSEFSFKNYKDFSGQIEIESPGRINLIGEHTDYNNGFVMPTAIDKKIYFKLRKNDPGSLCRLYSETYNSSFKFSLEKIEKSENAWENYILGVVNEIQKLGKQLSGFDCVLKSELPIGAGISSSAALECGLASGLNELFDLQLSKIDIIELAQRAEHNFVGSNCGIMDQYASVMSKKDHLILLDCESLDAEYIPADFKNCKILLLNTRVSHSLADSEYNTRRQECEEGVRIIAEVNPQVKSLRDVDEKLLESHRNKLPGKIYERCSYVIEENNRVVKAAKAIKKGDLEKFGELMYASHDGLQHRYEVSCSELDFLVDLSRDKNFIHGARMMGGGFGGCTINLIEVDKIDDFIQETDKAYFKEFGIHPEPIIVEADAGTIIYKN